MFFFVVVHWQPLAQFKAKLLLFFKRIEIGSIEGYESGPFRSPMIRQSRCLIYSRAKEITDGVGA